MDDNVTLPCAYPATEDFLLFYNNSITKLQNSPSFNSSDDRGSFICAYWTYLQFAEYMRLCGGCIRFVCSFFGVISAVLTLITLHGNAHFNALCFTFFRLINVLETFYMLRMAIDGVYAVYYCQCASWYSCAYVMAAIRPPVGNVFAICVNLLAIFLSVERVVACLFPTYFYLINQARVYAMFALSAMLISIGSCLPQIFANQLVQDPASQTYVSAFSGFGQSRAYQLFISIGLSSFLYTQVVAAVLTTGLLVFGVIRVIKRKARLANQDANGHPRGQASTRNVIRTDNVAKTLQLCYLQISQATPIAIHLSVYALSKNHIDVYIGSLSDIELGYRAYNLRLLSHCTDCLAHCFHFYAYLAFGKTFQNATKRKFFNK